MGIEPFFRQLGLDEKETRVVMSVLRLGAQPASVLAKHVKLDRTTTYRILKALYEKKLLKQATQRGVTVFYIENLSDIEHYLEKRKKRLERLQKEFQELTPQLASLRSSVQALPRIQIYEGYDRLENFYRDIVERAVEQGLLLIRILGSNTFSQQLQKKGLGEMIQEFEREMRAHALEADILIAQGNLTREWVTRLPSLGEMGKLPAAGGATNVILVGESVFMVSFRDFPVGVRIDHPDIAQTFHFLFDISQKSAN